MGSIDVGARRGAVVNEGVEDVVLVEQTRLNALGVVDRGEGVGVVVRIRIVGIAGSGVIGSGGVYAGGVPPRHAAILP